MNDVLVEKIAQAVLYEGYILYPYRPSVKNHQRWTLGGLYPQAFSESNGTGDAFSLLAECILTGDESASVQIKARFLHLIDRQVAKPGADLVFVDSIQVGEKKYQRWQEAIERAVVLPAIAMKQLLSQPLKQDFAFPANAELEEIKDADGKLTAVLIREQQAIAGSAEVSAEKVDDGIFRLSVRMQNQTPMQNARSNGERSFPPRAVGVASRSSVRDEALMRSLVSAHLILGVTGGQFISMTGPPEQLKHAVAACKNVGVWPVLVGDVGDTGAILASPIILYDYPQIAPESPGDLFDGTEIDEILTLRVMTLTDEEKRDVASVDERAGEMLKRTESLAREQLMNLHGGMRGGNELPNSDVFPAWDFMEDRPKLPSIRSGGVDLHPGDRVRLRPRGGADAFDIMLAGKIATIAVIEQDYEDRIHLAVTIEDDPGADFGRDGKPGHRFFFRPDEVEPLETEISEAKSEV